MSTETDEEIKCIINGSIIGRSGNTARALLQGRGTAKDAGRLWNVLEHAGDALKGDVHLLPVRSERDYPFPCSRLLFMPNQFDRSRGGKW